VIACQAGLLLISAFERWRWHAHLILSLQQEHVTDADREFEASGAARLAAKSPRRRIETQFRADAEALNAPSQNAEMRVKRLI
jgi:hypothetical protein